MQALNLEKMEINIQEEFKWAQDCKNKRVFFKFWNYFSPLFEFFYIVKVKTKTHAAPSNYHSYNYLDSYNCNYNNIK